MNKVTRKIKSRKLSIHFNKSGTGTSELGATSANIQDPMSSGTGETLMRLASPTSIF